MRRTRLLVLIGLLAAGHCGLGTVRAGTLIDQEIAARLHPLIGLSSDAGRLEILWSLPPPAQGSIAALAFEPRDRAVTGEVVQGAGSRQRIEGQVRLVSPVPAPVRAIAQGEMFEEGNLGNVDVDLLTLRRGVVTTASLVLDRVARRPLEAGRPILARDLSSPPAVARHDIVTLKVQSGRVLVRARGKALDSAAMGERVRVQNVDSRRVVVGTVVDRGVVEVSGAGP